MNEKTAKTTDRYQQIKHVAILLTSRAKANRKDACQACCHNTTNHHNRTGGRMYVPIVETDSCFRSKNVLFSITAHMTDRNHSSKTGKGHYSMAVMRITCALVPNTSSDSVPTLCNSLLSIEEGLSPPSFFLLMIVFGRIHSHSQTRRLVAFILADQSLDLDTGTLPTRRIWLGRRTPKASENELASRTYLMSLPIALVLEESIRNP